MHDVGGHRKQGSLPWHTLLLPKIKSPEKQSWWPWASPKMSLVPALKMLSVVQREFLAMKKREVVLYDQKEDWCQRHTVSLKWRQDTIKPGHRELHLQQPLQQTQRENCARIRIPDGTCVQSQLIFPSTENTDSEAQKKEIRTYLVDNGGRKEERKKYIY